MNVSSFFSVESSAYSVFIIIIRNLFNYYHKHLITDTQTPLTGIDSYWSVKHTAKPSP